MNTKSLTLALASLSVVSAAIPAGWTYGGCMILDHFTENISPPYVNTLNSSANTIELCLSTCATPYAGLDGDICYCGTSPFPALSPSADASCNTPCPGDASENCGGAIGFGWVSLYSKSANTTSSSSSSSSGSSTSSVISTSAPLSYTTSTIYATSTDTITSCAATITNCPARTSTTVYVIGTTIVPCSSETTTSSAILSTPTTTASAILSTTTTTPVYQNSTAIITSSPVTTLLTSTSVGSNTTTLKATATPTASTLPTGGANIATSWGVSALLVVAGVAALL